MAYQNARRPCIAKMILSVKNMYAIFFTTNGLAIQVSIPKGKSMNTRFYRNKVLKYKLSFELKYEQLSVNTDLTSIWACKCLGSFIDFLFKKWVYHIPACAEKGGYSARTSVLCHMLGVTQLPLPRPPPPPRGSGFLYLFGCNKWSW